jgi:hypothetical protein
MEKTQSSSEGHVTQCEPSGSIQLDGPNCDGNSGYLMEDHSDLKLQQQISSTEYLRLPFLKDKGTLDYVHMSKVMFVMRGLPESGRSGVVKYILSLFNDAAVCSVSEYFRHCER